MKSTTLILVVAVASIAFAGSFSTAPAAADSPAEAPVRIHQPSAIDEGIGVAPATEVVQPAPALDAQFGSAC